MFFSSQNYGTKNGSADAEAVAAIWRTRIVICLVMLPIVICMVRFPVFSVLFSRQGCSFRVGGQIPIVLDLEGLMS